VAEGGRFIDEPRYCPECAKELEMEVNELFQLIFSHENKPSPRYKKVEMVKIVPLGCPTCSIGGFIWQCPVCKTIVADWKEIK
jgi:rubrerythrin